LDSNTRNIQFFEIIHISVCGALTENGITAIFNRIREKTGIFQKPIGGFIECKSF
jgi:hypothetical protein